ncbi:hypothetical protein quinque_015091 [Culex quinquefasciatus]
MAERSKALPLIATLITTQEVTSISVSDGNGPRHLRPLGPIPPPPPGPNHPALRRYASGVKGLVPGGGGRPPPRLTARVDSPSVVGSNSTTVDPEPAAHSAYNYMPIRSQPRPQEQSQPTQYIHHHHHQTGSGGQHQSPQSHQSSKSPILSLQQYQTRLPQQQQQQTSSLSGLGGDLPLVYQSYQPQMHLRYQSSSSGSSSTSSQSQPLKTILINNAPIQYEYSQRHQPSSSSSSTSGSGRDPNLPLLYSARNQLQQHQQQQFAPPPSSKLYAIEQPKPQPSVQSSVSFQGRRFGVNSCWRYADPPRRRSPGVRSRLVMLGSIFLALCVASLLASYYF